MNLISIHSCPRSGSTWLQTIFESHPNVKTLFQPLFSYRFKNCINKSSTKEDFTNFINELKDTDDEFCNMKSDYHTDGEKLDIPRFEKENLETLLMKHVTHHNLIETFIKLYPSIKIIGLIRDPCSVIHSQQKAKYEKLEDWLNGSDKNKDKEEFFFGFNKWLEVKDIFYTIKKKYPENIIIVNYEDLIKNPLEGINNICKFCKLKFHSNLMKSVSLMNSKNDNYDYSVFRKENTLEKWKGKLDTKISEYIKKYTYKIAICVCLNEVYKAEGTTKKGIKELLNYVEQFLILYYSIKENWSFNYKIYLFHSRPFNASTLNILNRLDVVLINIKTTNLLIRPESYLVDLPCDYRLTLDVDMVALDNPSFNFNFDAQGAYGDFNYQYLPEDIFNKLNIKKPSEKDYMKYNLINTMKNTLFSNKNCNLGNDFYKKPFDYKNRYYPIFNHGAILVKNKYSNFIGEKLLLYKKIYKTNSGQDVIGIIINHITNNNWTHFEKGFNFTYNSGRYLNKKSEWYQKDKEKYISEGGKISLFHYVLLEKESIFFKKYISKYYDLVKKIFLNIIILFSPNYNNKKEIGTVKKSIDFMSQFIFFYNTIKKNLKTIEYDITVVHYQDFNNEDLNILKKLDVDIVKIKTNNLFDAGLERYNINTRTKGTHRLMTETDMLMLKEPNFNWDVDFQKGYDGDAKIFDLKTIDKIFKIFDVKNKYIKNYNKNRELFISYNIKKINKKDLFPHFNNGLTLVKEDFSKIYYNKVKSMNLLEKRNKHFDSKYHHYFGQILHSLIPLEITDNWEPFEPGINYLLKTYDINKFGKENVSLVHYCGIGSGELVKKIFPDYFNNK